ncbi:AAA family ATPase [Flavobacterium sp. LS1R10]|uniref:AAA family ATPase n=1 Tax=Flavobacterium sp. LS1R10 TaxID=2497482 RepID=UPI000F84BACA|nr:AAA family ATPase [Flavobacterium sp. LS1R10]RTY76232.1 hypothetical protein EKL96_01705 [Flavobacterium sp. LS1R10]
MAKIVNNQGLILEGKDLDFNNQKEYLERSLAINNWTYELIQEGNSGYVCYKLKHANTVDYIIHVYLKPVKWRSGRVENEKQHQMQGSVDMRGYNAPQSEFEKTFALGIYADPTSSDYLICGWDAFEWGPNKGEKPFNYNLKVDLLSEAFKFGFSNTLSDGRKIFAFKPEFIYYYLLNKDLLHGTGRNEENEVVEPYPLTDQPLNQILYGPPGTGKTHHSINHALSIVKGNDLSDMTREQIKKEFDAFVESGQIQFVTFHQSYSYEEFVEGIKPQVNANGDIEYHIEDGIFKKLCKKAQDLSILNVGDTFLNSHNSAHSISKFTNDIVEITRDEGSIITFPTKLITGLLELLANNVIELINIQTKEKDGIHLQDFLQDFLGIRFDKYIFGYNSVLKALIEFILSKEKFNNANYVLIIDEINRGNISKIFGELITLIEDSKRIGAKESLRAKLTYSGANSVEMFGVPSNVYIVGTMNTADRSIALIDTALRRRFVFFEYSAETSLLNVDVEGIDLRALVSMMNERIEFLLDKDHLLGHAFFLNIRTKDELCSVFRNKILPLLEEYFYGDYEKIQLVLGDNKEFGKKDENRIVIPKPTSEQKKIFGKEVDGFEEKTLYKINENLVVEDFESITTEFFTSIYSKQLKEA